MLLIRRSRQFEGRVLIFFLLFVISALLPTTSYGQQLYSVDLEALTQIHSNLQDLPGSNFFSTWDFSQDPCSTFGGIQCYNVNGNSRVVVLNLGTPWGSSPGLQGNLSPYVGNLTALVQLSLVPGQVSGSIPSTVGSLSSLQFLGLSQNQFSGKIPSSLSNLYNLQSLILDGNYLYGTIPSAIGSLTSLITFSASNNQLTGRIPDFSSAWSLRHIDLSINHLNGKLQGFPQGLVYLSLANNQLDEDLEEVAGLGQLNFLDLSSNQLSGSIPYQIFSFPLQSLLLHGNSLSGQLDLSAYSNIQVVDLSYNNLTGLVPAALGNVQQLSLNDNRFSGMVPAIFASGLQDGAVQSLHLENNYLIGLSNLLSGMNIAPMATLCFQYNCGLSPPQSLCPGNTGVQGMRPLDECLDARNWS